MKLTISIVNWNVSGYLEKCLESIFKFSEGIGLEVIVVDNASKDNSVLMLREKFPRVRLIENTENVGYGSGHNQAIAVAKGEYILFLNPDSEMFPETLPRTVQFMDSYHGAGAVMCREVGSIDEKDSGWEIGVVLKGYRRFLWHFCTLVEKIFSNPLTRNVLINFLIQRRAKCQNGIFFLTLSFLEGGFLLVRRCVLEQTGLFSRRIFYGGEGEELTKRIKKMGWSLYLLLNVSVIHYTGKSASQMSDEEFKKAALSVKGGENR